MSDENCVQKYWDENCLQIILFYGHKGRLVEKMAEVCGCEQAKAHEFINEYFTFLTKDTKRVEPTPEPE